MIQTFAFYLFAFLVIASGVFTITARLDNGAEAIATAPSKRAAEQAAAAEAVAAALAAEEAASAEAQAAAEAAEAAVAEAEAQAAEDAAAALAEAAITRIEAAVTSGAPFADALADLSDDHRDALMSSVDAALDHYVANYNGATMEAWGPALAERGIERVTFANSEIEAFKAAAAAPAAAAWLEQNTAAGLPAQDLYDLVTGMIADDM